MDGDIDGADAQVDDPLDLPWGEVGEGDIVAHEEAEPGIVILEVEGIPAPGGHLVHEAEQTVVGAWPRLVHEVGLEVESQLRRLRLFDPHRPSGALRGLQHQLGVPVVAEEAVVQHVLHGVAADGDEPFAGTHSGPLRRGAMVDGCDDSTHGALLDILA